MPPIKPFDKGPRTIYTLTKGITNRWVTYMSMCALPPGVSFQNHNNIRLFLTIDCWLNDINIRYLLGDRESWNFLCRRTSEQVHWEKLQKYWKASVNENINKSKNNWKKYKQVSDLRQWGSTAHYDLRCVTIPTILYTHNCTHIWIVHLSNV